MRSFSRAYLRSTEPGARVATEADLEACTALRVAAMRPSLERLGRFDPTRARDIFARKFVTLETLVVEPAGTLVGLMAVRTRADHLFLNHLYIAPAAQGSGLGQRLLRPLLTEADALGANLRLIVLVESPALAFYARHGFDVHRIDGVDIEMRRSPVYTPEPS